MQTNVLQWVQGQLNRVFNADLQPPLQNSNYIIPAFAIGGLDSDLPVFTRQNSAVVFGAPAANANLWSTTLQIEPGSYDIYGTLVCLSAQLAHRLDLEVFDAAGASVTIMQSIRVPSGVDIRESWKLAVVLEGNQGFRCALDSSADTSTWAGSVMWKKRLL